MVAGFSVNAQGMTRRRVGRGGGGRVADEPPQTKSLQVRTDTHIKTDGKQRAAVSHGMVH